MCQKTFGFVFIFIWLSMQSHAEEGSEHKESSGSSSIFSGTIGPMLQVSQFGDGAISTLGGRINMTLFNVLLLGIGGHGKIAQSDLGIGGKAENDLSFYYGGVSAGIRLFPHSFIHLTNYNTFGIGGLNLKGHGKSGLVYLIEPELNLELDLLSLIRLGAGLSYRWMFAKHMDVTNSSLSGVGGQIFIEFGWL